MKLVIILISYYPRFHTSQVMLQSEIYPECHIKEETYLLVHLYYSKDRGSIWHI